MNKTFTLKKNLHSGSSGLLASILWLPRILTPVMLYVSCPSYLRCCLHLLFFHSSLRCGQPLMIAQSAVLLQTRKTNLSVRIFHDWRGFMSRKWLLFPSMSVITDTKVDAPYSSIKIYLTLIFSFSKDCNIAISTYSMVSFTGKRSWEAGEVGIVSLYLLKVYG